MHLTPDQRDLFDALGVGVNLPGGTFTSEQVRNFTARSFQWVCELDGVGVPSEAAMLAEVDLRSPGWPGDWTEPRSIGPSKADPSLIDSLYPPEGPFGKRPE